MNHLLSAQFGFVIVQCVFTDISIRNNELTDAEAKPAPVLTSQIFINT